MPSCKGKTQRGTKCRNKCKRKYCYLHSRSNRNVDAKSYDPNRWFEIGPGAKEKKDTEYYTDAHFDFLDALKAIQSREDCKNALRRFHPDKLSQRGTPITERTRGYAERIMRKCKEFRWM